MLHDHFGRRYVIEISKRPYKSQSALSQHLARLRRDGLVRFRRESQTLHYRVGDRRALRVLGVLKDLFCAAPLIGDRMCSGTGCEVVTPGSQP